PLGTAWYEYVRPSTESREERRAARLDELGDRHVGQLQRGVEVRPDGIAHQAVDSGQRSRGIRSVQYGERRPALEREERADLPAAKDLADDATLIAHERQLPHEVAGQP